MNEIFGVRWLAPLGKLTMGSNILALTLGSTVYWTVSEAVAEWYPHIRAHEAVHVTQYARYGIFGFLIRYLWYYLYGMARTGSPARAYRQHPLEVEAYAAERAFLGRVGVGAGSGT